MKLSQLPQVQELPVREKLKLVDEIWKDVAQELEVMEISSEEKQILDGRWETFLNNPDSALTSEDFINRLNVLRE